MAETRVPIPGIQPPQIGSTEQRVPLTGFTGASWGIGSPSYAPPAPAPAPIGVLPPRTAPTNPSPTSTDSSGNTTTSDNGSSSTVNPVQSTMLSGNSSTPSPGNMEPAPLPTVSTGSPPTNPGSTALSFAQVENFWIQAGGSPQAAAMAAAVADAESGLNANASRTNPDGSIGLGLWLIPANGTPPGSTDPLANARAAVQLSQNGTDWTQWCSTWSDNNCGQNNGTYLGQGANALMSLGTQSPGASYNVFGATPAGSGVSASSATSGLTAPTTSQGSSKTLLLLGGLVIAIILIFFLVNRKKAGKDSSQEPVVTQ